jgi:hypothetical protein
VNTNLRKTIGQIRSGFLAMLATTALANLHAATITVTNAADSGTGSLRGALASAANGDTINFALATPAKITLTSGELVVSKSVSILGPGPASLAVNGNWPVTTNRVFHILPGLNVVIAGLTVTNGHITANSTPSDWAGGIFNDHSVLTVSNCTVVRNVSNYGGGGIYNDGSSSGHATLKVIASTVFGNSAVYGDGIENFGVSGDAKLIMIASTIYNSIDNDGISYEGIPSGNATVTVTNSTLYSVVNDGIGVGGNATLTVIGSTLFGRSIIGGFYRGCIHNDGSSSGHATVNIGDTILFPWSNAFTGDSITDNSGVVNSLGYNLSIDDGGGFLTATGDQINTDPMLGPLRDNGGPTFTFAPLPGSPAIDRGKNFSGFATDQRGFPRTNDDLSLPNATGGDGTDIGAFEFQKLVNLAMERDGSGGFFIHYTGAPDVTYRPASAGRRQRDRDMDQPRHPAGRDARLRPHRISRNLPAARPGVLPRRPAVTHGI